MPFSHFDKKTDRRYFTDPVKQDKWDKIANRNRAFGVSGKDSDFWANISAYTSGSNEFYEDMGDFLKNILWSPLNPKTATNAIEPLGRLGMLILCCLVVYSVHDFGMKVLHYEWANGAFLLALPFMWTPLILPLYYDFEYEPLGGLHDLCLGCLISLAYYSSIISFVYINFIK